MCKEKMKRVKAEADLSHDSESPNKEIHLFHMYLAETIAQVVFKENLGTHHIFKALFIEDLM